MAGEHRRMTLVIGGARSGKSTWAEQLAADGRGIVTYVATAEVFDDEMKHRIDVHRSRRPDHWETLEQPRYVARALAHLRKQRREETPMTVLIDCLTLFVSNWMFFYEGADDDELIDNVLDRVDELVREAARFPGRTIIVTNEVGYGIVPDNRLGRLFRDVAGLANQKVAAASDEVYWTVAGIPVELKQLQAEITRNDVGRS